jgi:quinol monooxygenase YgiN
MKVLAVIVAATLAVSSQQVPMDKLAERYVRLVLATGQHDADYVDAFYGPSEWRKQAEAARRSLVEIDTEAAAVLSSLNDATPPGHAEELVGLRHRYPTRQLQALRARVGMLQGRTLTFDAESKALYDAVAPTHADVEFETVIAELDKRLPGDGAVLERYDAFRNRFVIPKEKLDGVFKAAIDGCRARTLKHITLPAAESFTVEYVTKKSWGGYNWYQGNHRSLIQVNTDLPIYINRALDLACHEGYPGHHVYNALLEKNLVRDRGWVEFSVYALFSPQSLIAEGTANYGIEVAFPKVDRLAFEREVLFPAAGLDPAKAAAYYDVLGLVERLSYADNEAARRYLDRRIDAKAAVEWLMKYALMPKERAEQRLRFIEQYRSYVINYNLGKDMVAAYVEKRAGADPEKRWREFEKLLSSPRLPSDLR